MIGEANQFGRRRLNPYLYYGTRHTILYKYEGRWVFKWLVFLIGDLDLIGMWFGEEQSVNIMKTHV
jgi:hypothetical protein